MSAPTPASLRRDAAHRLGVELRRALRHRGMTQLALADLIGVSPKTVQAWAQGRKLPLHESVVTAADAMDWPGLVRVSLAVRTKTCELAACGRLFTDMGLYRKARFCGPRCAGTDFARRVRARTAVRDEFARRRLPIYVAAVDTFCRECEPEGLCRTPACPIQVAGLSPLRVDKRLAFGRSVA